jgi:S1-C subfamily serine protease
MANLNRTLGSTLAAVISLAAAPLAATATDLPTDGAVVVQGHIPGFIALGAGTIISETSTTIRVITANHVATKGTLTIRLPDGSNAQARIVVQFPASDLAIIEAPISAAQAAIARPAQVAAPRSNEPVRILGGSNAGPALEVASIAHVGQDLPDGPANGRYAVDCNTCHRGDSGGGVFDANGDLVGVYVGYFEMDDKTRVSVAETLPAAALKIALSNTSATPAMVALSGTAP